MTIVIAIATTAARPLYFWTRFCPKRPSPLGVSSSKGIAVSHVLTASRRIGKHLGAIISDLSPVEHRASRRPSSGKSHDASNQNHSCALHHASERLAWNSSNMRGGKLTDREQQVAALVCKGLSNKLVARTLNVTEGTIKTHLHAIYSKLRLGSRFALIEALVDRPIG